MSLLQPTGNSKKANAVLIKMRSEALSEMSQMTHFVTHTFSIWIKLLVAFVYFFVI